MGTNKPQILLTLDKDLLKRIEKYQKNKKFFSRSEAVRQLIEAGLKTIKKKK
jgi:metal-responsive CopG/Arc/MetJ family transcriptional regulator